MRTYTRKYDNEWDARTLHGKKLMAGIRAAIFQAGGFWWVQWTQ